MYKSLKENMANVEIRKERTGMELLEKVLDAGNIVDAYKKVLSNKGAGGIDNITCEEFSKMIKNGKINFEGIKEQIRTRKYKPSPVKRVYIPKENGDKRGLGIPTIIDRQYMKNNSVKQVMDSDRIVHVKRLSLNC